MACRRALRSLGCCTEGEDRRCRVRHTSAALRSGDLTLPRMSRVPTSKSLVVSALQRAGTANDVHGRLASTRATPGTWNVKTCLSPYGAPPIETQTRHSASDMKKAAPRRLHEQHMNTYFFPLSKPLRGIIRSGLKVLGTLVGAAIGTVAKSWELFVTRAIVAHFRSGGQRCAENKTQPVLETRMPLFCARRGAIFLLPACWLPVTSRRIGNCARKKC